MDHHAKKALKALLGPEGFSEHPADREAFSYDATGPAPPPEVVLHPRSTDEVAAVIGLANQFRFPIVPRGAGSGLTGGSLIPQGGAVLVLARMNRILEIDPDDMVARVEPGVVTGELQEAVEAKGLFYPPDPASRAFSTIGGNLAECAGGLRAVKYGVTRDYVLGLTAVLGDGRIIEAGTRTIKGVVGYDLARLLIGSEGTLGVITEATLKLIPKPRAKATLAGVFPDLESAARGVNAVFRTGVLPVALEFMERLIMESVADLLPFPLEPGDGAMVLAEVDGSPAACAEEAEGVVQAFESQGGRVVRADDRAVAEALWAARRAVSPATRKIKPNKIAEDVAVPRSKLPEFVGRLGQIGREMGLTVASYGHAGDGNVHVNVLFERQDEAERAQETVARIMRTCLDMGGTLSGEHGIGTTKAPFLHWELSPLEIELLVRLKKVFDPNGILNPGKIFHLAAAHVAETETGGD